MTKDEELDLALEALEAWLPTVPNLIEKKKAAITAIKQARSAPVQEPVAWFKHGPYEDGEPLSVVFENPHDDVCYSPLGFIDTPPAAQRQWVGLTDDEVDECYESVMFNADIEPTRVLVYQAIEAKLKEKNT
jgi:hypothetical protein